MMPMKVKKEFFTVREFIKELEKLSDAELDSPLVSSKYNHEAGGFALDAVTEIIGKCDAFLLPSGYIVRPDHHTDKRALDLQDAKKIKVVTIY